MIRKERQRVIVITVRGFIPMVARVSPYGSRWEPIKEIGICLFCETE